MLIVMQSPSVSHFINKHDNHQNEILPIKHPTELKTLSKIKGITNAQIENRHCV